MEHVRCLACDAVSPVNTDGIYICVGCGAWGPADGIPRVPPPLELADAAATLAHPEPWHRRDVESLLRILAHIAHAIDRLAEAPPSVHGFAVTVTPQRKESAPMSFTVQVPPVSTTTAFNLSIAVQPVGAGGTPLPDTLVWSTSDPAIVSGVEPSADTLIGLANVVAAGSCVVSFADPAGNTGTLAITVTEAVTGFNVTVTPSAKP